MADNKKLMQELKEAKESFDSTRSGKEIKELKKQVKEKDVYILKLQDMLLKAENEADKYKQIYNDSLLTSTDENMDLKKQLSQLEKKESTVSKDKYESLQTAFEEMRKDNIKVRKELETMQKMYYNASDKVKDQTEKNNQIKALKEQLKLSQKDKSLAENSINQNEYDTMSLKIKELESKLSRKDAGAGRKREVNIKDADILKLRAEGITVKVISEKTGLSTATINRILKNNKS